MLALCPLKLFLTSRKRPSWATSRRLLYGDIYEIGRSLLAMSQEEAEEVLADRRGSEASGLVALADGWPAVIGLAALTDEIELPDEGVPEALYAYFAEELYQAADPELRWSLSQLSLSSTVAPAVAQAVLGDEAERALLDGRRLGFLVPSEQGVDEIHPFFASSSRKSSASSQAIARRRSSSSSCERTSGGRSGTTPSRSSSASSTRSYSWKS